MRQMGGVGYLLMKVSSMRAETWRLEPVTGRAARLRYDRRDADLCPKRDFKSDLLRGKVESAVVLVVPRRAARLPLGFRIFG
jgi:hypothetical protein